MNWKIVFTDKDVLRAELINAELQSKGLESVLLNKKDSIYPFLGISEIRTKPEDAERAEQIIKTLND